MLEEHVVHAVALRLVRTVLVLQIAARTGLTPVLGAVICTIDLLLQLEDLVRQRVYIAFERFERDSEWTREALG